MTEIEKKASEIFTTRFGKTLDSRIIKLKEEFNEFIEAYEEYVNHSGTYDHMIEELSDLQSVLSHITSILGESCDSLLIESIIKASIRKELPNYKRKNNE